MEVKKRDYSKLTDVVYNIELRQQKLLLEQPKQFKTVKEIPDCEAELGKFKTLVKDAIELRTPLTKKLDEVKARLMECEKELKRRENEVANNLLQLKKELEREREKIKKINDYKNDYRLAFEQSKHAYLLRIKKIIEENSTAFLSGKLNLTLEQFAQALVKRINKEKFTPCQPVPPEGAENLVDELSNQYKPADVINEAFRLMDEAINELRNNNPVEVKVKDTTLDAIFDKSISNDVEVVQTKGLKYYYVLEHYDLKQIVSTWINNWDFINSKFRVKSIENITIGQIVDIICKYKEDIQTDLKFIKKEKI